jgi:GxxExxY protein
MPIHCPISFPRLSEDDMRAIDYAVMGHAFATHRKLGRMCDESVYQRELLRRLQNVGMEASIEIPITLSHREFSTRLELDLVVDQRVIYELKTLATLSAAHQAQLLGYIFLTNSTRGKLINFRLQSVQSRFVNTTFSDAERRRYTLQRSQFAGDDRLIALVRELIDDWGTGLNASLYRRAILQCLSDESIAERMLPMRSGERPIGNQRFHLLDQETALGVTTFPDPHDANIEDFRKLLTASPLSQLHWLNITHRQVSLCTVRSDRKI